MIFVYYRNTGRKNFHFKIPPRFDIFLTCRFPIILQIQQTGDNHEMF